MNAQAKRKPKLSKQYELYLRSKAWECKRNLVIYRDGAQCKACGSRDKLEVHHLTYARFTKELLDDLITLCETCHKALHKAKAKQTNEEARQ